MVRLFHGRILYIEYVCSFSFLNTAASPAGIAVIHSLFNIGATILLFPFANLLEKMAILAIPDKGSEVEEMEEEKINQILQD